jgi:hypothetical protein
VSVLGTLFGLPLSESGGTPDLWWRLYVGKFGVVGVRHNHSADMAPDACHELIVYWPNETALFAYGSTFEEAKSRMRRVLVERGHHVFGQERAA